MPRPRAPLDEPDPLYDPVLLAFLWAGWLATTMLGSPRAGLVVLVVGALVLMASGLRTDRPIEIRTFSSEFASMLFYCAAAIAAAVLGLSATASEAQATLAASCFVGAAGVLAWLAMQRIPSAR